jgi:DNA-binding transcriptional MerR regulator
VEKSPDAFRTISEVAQDLDVPQHVLRFWESRFREIKPMKRGGGRRYYRPDDVDLLRGIRHLLYGEGYTIRGVQRLLREQGVRFVQGVWQPGAPQPAPQAADEAPEPEVDEPEAQSPPPRVAPAGLPGTGVQKLEAALAELRECRRLLDAAIEP